MDQQTIIIAAIVGVVIAFLAVALFLLTRKPKKEHSSPLAQRNPNYDKPAAQEHSSAKVTVQEKPKVEAAAPSPLKPAAEQPKAEEKPAEKKVEPKPAAQQPTPVPQKEEPKPTAKKPVADEEDGWGDDDDWGIASSNELDLDSVGETSEDETFSKEVKAQQEEAGAKPKKMVDRRSSEDDEDDWGDTDGDEQDLEDGWTGPTLARVSPEIKKAFKDSSLNQEFHVSKRKEADELIVKCVQAYLKDNTDPAVKAAHERIYALHSNIQLSDLPEIVESFVDSGEEGNQRHFADFEDMCNTHEDSVLVLFEKFNTTLPLNLRSRRIAEISEPLPAVIYLAPEWEDDDFDRPDFDERDEDIDDSVDYLEDFYDQLEDDEDESDKKQA